MEEIIQDSIQEGNRLGYFAALYKRVTVRVEEGIENKEFNDNQAMERLDVVFANRYLEAYDLYKADKPVTESWKVAFDAANEWHILVLQQLFVGMNAHISLDLGIAAYEVYGENLPNNEDDFNKINEILGSLVDTVQDELASFWWIMKVLDKVARQLDEKLADFAMKIARDAAWKFAMELRSTPNEELEEVIEDRDDDVAEFGWKLVHPGFILYNVIRVLKLFEFGSVASKIEKLNTPASAN